MWTIYKHLNSTSGKAYIGLTSSSVEDRWAQHRYTAASNCIYHFHKAIRKYPANTWEHAILHYGIRTLAEACELEQQYILRYNTFKEGYNATLGGEGVTVHSDIKDSVRTFKHEVTHEVFIGTARELQQAFGLKSVGNLQKVLDMSHTRSSIYGWRVVNSAAADIRPSVYNGIPVYKYTEDLEFVNRYSCAAEASKTVNSSVDGIYNRCITATCTSSLHKGFRWSHLAPYEVSNIYKELGYNAATHVRGTLRKFNNAGEVFIGTARQFSSMAECSEPSTSRMIRNSTSIKGWTYTSNIVIDTLKKGTI